MVFWHWLIFSGGHGNAIRSQLGKSVRECSAYLRGAGRGISFGCLTFGGDGVCAGGRCYCGTGNFIYCPDAQSFMRPFANVAQPNQLALILCMGLASLWYLFQKFRLGALISCVLALFYCGVSC